MNAIPNVDLSDFISGVPARKKHFVEALGNAYHEVGFVSVSNHGIDSSLVNNFYDAVRMFFAFPEDVKRKYEITALAGQRGYTSFGKEHAKQSQAADLKEFWQFGQWVNGENPELHAVYPDNVEVTELPQFSALGKRLYRNFEHTGGMLLQAIAIYLGLEETYFDNKIKNGNSILRAIYYPPILKEPASAIRAEQHEDINLITLLVGASADGLEVQDKDGRWVPVRSLADQIVVNVGDMLQRLTNDVLRSTTHRVVNPPREMWHTSRLSIPFFLHPVSEMDLSCLPGCITAENPLHYEPITAGAYLDERLREIGLKK